MDEAEAHMDTDVSSTTEDILEIVELAGPHRNVETTVVVEEVKEEDMSPNKEKNKDQPLGEAKTSESESVKHFGRLAQREIPLKKIIIKSLLKDISLINPVPKTPSKEEFQTSGRDAQLNKPVTSTPRQPEDVIDSSSKIETNNPAGKDLEVRVQISPVQNEDMQKLSPNSDIREPELIKSKGNSEDLLAVTKSTPVMEQSVRNKIVKEQTDKTTNVKEQPAKTSPVKELSVKTTPLKELIMKTTQVKDNAQTTPVKETPVTTTPVKEQPVKTTPVKEQPIKTASVKEQFVRTTPVKEQPVKTTPVKEQPLKTTPVKEQPLKTTPVKEQPVKTTPVKEQPVRTTPVKEMLVREKSKPQEKLAVDSTYNSKLEESSSRSSIGTTMDIDKEASNDSQMETLSDTSEKEHNKSISRELRSLINSAKESKIISECNQLTSKTRKSRAPLDSSNSSLNASVEADKIQGVRRCSENSQKSSCSEKSEKAVLKRSMRSQNPEFVTKVKQFLNSVTGKISKEEGDVSDEEMEEIKRKENQNELKPSASKKKKAEDEDGSNSSSKLRSDPYCWRCHWIVEPTANEKMHPSMHCTVCPRSYHFKCLTGPERNKINTDKNWVCPECLMVLHAESSETRSPAMKKIPLGMLCDLLKYALERMMDLNGVEPFTSPVDRSTFPDYNQYVVHPMDLSLMKQNIADGLYGSTEAFLADAQWILHNSIIFNTLQSKLTSGARSLVRSCRAEMAEIEACPECYAAAHGRRPTWFTDVCTTPHILLWAKLKGFPYWPAKAMSTSSAGQVDVRFFGAHDRAWVPARDCFLYSEKDPNNFRTKRQDILDSMQEAEQHIRNISRKHGKFVYPPFKTQFDPTKLYEQLKMMIPSFEGEVRTPMKEKQVNTSPGMVKDKNRSYSKSSKCSLNDGDTSESEETPPRKMADGAEIAREEDDFTIEKKEKDKIIDVDASHSKDIEASRKRRRSEMEEAVITIIDSSSKEKKKRVDSVDKTEDIIKTDLKEPSTSKDLLEKPKESETSKDKPLETTPKLKVVEASISSAEKTASPRVPPIRLISIAKVMKNAKMTSPRVNIPKATTTKPITPKDNIVEKPQKVKTRLEKSISNEKEKRASLDGITKMQKRRNSRSNRSLNNSNTKSDKKNEKATESSSSKDKSKDNAVSKDNEINKNVSDKATPEKSAPSSSNAESPRSLKDRIQFDDDTSLAVLARQTGKNASTSNVRLPTISSVRSLSTIAQTAETTTKTTTTPKTIEITVEASSNSSIFTPTSTDNVRNMKEAVNKLQKLRNENESPVGKVGVRAFARITSPPEKETRANDVQVEIKTEPMDLDDADRQMEKMDLMNAFQLRPVNPPTSSLREVRINKVVVTPLTTRKILPKPPEIRPRAKKTFPQPKKSDDGRSELNSKNSMVYIPIQPPMTQAPMRAQRPNANGPGSMPLAPRAGAPVNTTSTNSIVNTVTSPLVPATMSTLSIATPTSAPALSNSTTPVQSAPTVGQVPTTVHTVPLITAVNGQWSFCLQPVMSVGSVEGTSSPPMLNGLTDRTSAPLVPVPSPATTSTSTMLVQAAPPVMAPLSSNTPTRTANDNHAPGEPPRLQQRPSLTMMNPLDASAPVGSVPPPSTAGPLTAKLNQNAVKMTDFFRTLLEDSLEKLDEPATQITTLKLQLEQASWRHRQVIDEMKHNHDLTLAEMRSSFDKDKARLVSETRRAAQAELEAAVKLAKSKQWCANCSQEAQFYCCWNTSYCDYPCQRAHWAQHYAVCTQQRAQDGSNSSDGSIPPESRLQPQPDSLPKSMAAPSLTVGGKLAPSRVYSQEPQHAAQKPSIIVSMVEDTSGNQTMKCVGTYKSMSAPTQMSPLIINKQLMNNEEAAKKVVTSGGYLIVGASSQSSNSLNSAPSIVTPPRRPHTIQYYT